MDFRGFLHQVRIYWKAFVATTLLLAGAAIAWLILHPMAYVANTQLLVSVQGSTTAAAYQNDQVVVGRIDSYITLLTSDAVGQRVIDKLGLSMSPKELAAEVSAVNVPPNTAVIDVEVTDASPERARRIADTLAAEFVVFVDALEAPTGEDGQRVQTTVVSAAGLPHTRIVERVALGGLAAVAALVVGLVVVGIRSATDRVLRTPARAALASGLPVLGSATIDGAASIADLNEYRRVRTLLGAQRDDYKLLQFTSVDRDADAVNAATNMSRVLETSSTSVIVVNATDVPNVSPPPDDADVLALIAELERWASAPEAATSREAVDVLERLRERFDKVIVASPSVLATPAATAIGWSADAVVILATLGVTTRRDLRRVAKEFEGTGTHFVALLLATGATANRTRRPFRRRRTGATGAEQTRDG